MKHLIITRALRGIALGSCAASALAHDGHGLSGAHWHSTDVWGFLALGVVAALAVWFSGRGKEAAARRPP